jgi:hypothetical protein
VDASSTLHGRNATYPILIVKGACSSGGGASGAAEPPVHSRDRATPAWHSLHTAGNAAFMSSQPRDSGIHALRSGAGEASVTEVRFRCAPRPVARRGAAGGEARRGRWRGAARPVARRGAPWRAEARRGERTAAGSGATAATAITPRMPGLVACKDPDREVRLSFMSTRSHVLEFEFRGRRAHGKNGRVFTSFLPLPVRMPWRK